MREYELEILDRYDMEIKSTRKIRGAFFCDTNEGMMLLKETRISQRRAALLYLVQDRLEDAGILTDTPVFSKDGMTVVTSGDGKSYMVKRWFQGRECDLSKEQDLTWAAHTLAQLHINMKLSMEPDLEPETGITESEGKQNLFPQLKEPVDELERHNRELRKIRSYVRGRVSKNEFEALFLKSFEEMYELAEETTERMRNSGAGALYESSIAAGCLVHGDYNYHNLIMQPDGIAVTGFEHMRSGIQVKDLGYFLRKVMEKCHWKQKTGMDILRAYESVRRLDDREKEYLALSLAYPEKYWKIAGNYYHSCKTRMPEKSVEKLRTAVERKEEKYRFIENICPFHLSCHVV